MAKKDQIRRDPLLAARERLREIRYVCSRQEGPALSKIAAALATNAKFLELCINAAIIERKLNQRRIRNLELSLQIKRQISDAISMTEEPG